MKYNEPRESVRHGFENESKATVCSKLKSSLAVENEAKPLRNKTHEGGSDVEGKAVTEEGILRVDHREDHRLTQGRFSHQNPQGPLLKMQLKNSLFIPPSKVSKI